MAARGGLVTYGSSVTAGMVTVREEGVGLFDHVSLARHKHISSLLMTGSVILHLKAHFCCAKRTVEADCTAFDK